MVHTQTRRKIVLAITGASGSIYALSLLNRLHEIQAPVEEIAVIFSETGKKIWLSEVGSAFYDEGSAKEYREFKLLCPIRIGYLRSMIQ